MAGLQAVTIPEPASAGLAVPSIVTIPSSPTPTKRETPFHFIDKRTDSAITASAVRVQPAAIPKPLVAHALVVPDIVTLPSSPTPERRELPFHFVDKRVDVPIVVSVAAPVTSTPAAPAEPAHTVTSPELAAPVVKEPAHAEPEAAAAEGSSQSSNVHQGGKQQHKGGKGGKGRGSAAKGPFTGPKHK